MIEHIQEGKYKYLQAGKGQPIVIQHGLMGGLSNFQGVVDYFAPRGYQIIIPELPLYDYSLIKTGVGTFAKFLAEFLKFKKLDNAILMGNSLGGHISLLTAKNNPELVKALVLTGSSGLYENSMGSSYPKRGDRQYVQEKTENVFFDPAVATDELVDEVFEIVNDRVKVVKTVAIAKSAIRHNMAKDLPNITVPSCIIWGKQDNVTPPEVGEEFNRLLPHSDLYWIDKCGHAPMMEHPDQFNEHLAHWLEKENL